MSTYVREGMVIFNYTINALYQSTLPIAILVAIQSFTGYLSMEIGKRKDLVPELWPSK